MKKHKQRRPLKNNRKSNNTLRIIAGQWRGRKLDFATAPGLRPTPDRVREMLFNWLQARLLDTRGLDLFAGSGALGFEAVSRGMKQIMLIESNRDATKYLQANIELLQTDQVQCIQTDAFQFLNSKPQAFDIIFLDPPFGKDYLPRLIKNIHDNNVLVANGLLYIEHGIEETIDIGASDISASDIGASVNTLKLIKEKTTGQVVSKLYEHQIN